MTTKLAFTILAFCAAIFLFVFAAFGWTLSDLGWQDEVAGGLVACAVAWLLDHLPA